MDMEETKKWYSLYTNKAQEKLLACASSEEQLMEVTQYYSGGTWFEYDDNNNRLTNEKLYKSVKFPKEPKEKPRYEDNKKINFKWVQ